MNDKMLAKLEHFLTKELLHTFDDIVIFKNDDGSYELFNKYHIFEDRTGYKISVNRSSNMKTFSSLKNAVTWCSFDNRNRINQAKRIEQLDQMLIGMDANISVHRNLVNKAKNMEYRLIYIAKMSEEQSKRKRIVEEMTSFINESKNWQTEKFAVNDK